ncbi:MAG: hypothetical protein V2A70_03040 [Candidatus Omnitrophota bacterium]
MKAGLDWRSVLIGVFLYGSFSSWPCLADDIGAFARRDAQAYHEGAYQAQMKGDLKRAKLLYDRARMFNPDDPSIINDMGLLDESLGKPADAEAKYLKAMEIDYKFLPAYTNLGYLYMNQGSFDKAIYYLERRVEYGSSTDKWTLEAQNMLSAIKRMSSTTVKTMMEADQLVLENSMLLRARERVYAGQTDDDVVSETEYQRGVRLFKARQYESALTSFEICLQKNSLDKKAEHMLARTRAMLMKHGSINGMATAVVPDNPGVQASRMKALEN